MRSELIVVVIYIAVVVHEGALYHRDRCLLICPGDKRTLEYVTNVYPHESRHSSLQVPVHLHRILLWKLAATLHDRCVADPEP